MRSAFNFTKYFKNFERNFKTTYTRFRIRPQASLNQYHLLASLFVGTVVIKHDDLLKCVNLSAQDGAQNYGSKGRLLFIRNRIHDDKNIDHFIQGLRQSGVDVIEVDLEATSDYMASLLQPKDINFIATNNEGDILEIPHGDENAQQKLRSFFRSVHEINKFSIHDFNRLAEKLKDNERIVFTYIPEQRDYKVGPFNPYDTYNKNKVKDIESLANTYRQLKNYHLSDTTSFFIIKDPVIAQSFQLSQDDIGEIYTIKKSSIYNNFETNTRINGQRVQISRIDLSDQERVDVQRDPELKSHLVKRKMYENCIDHVNYFQTQNELDNIRGLLSQLNVKKVFIYYRSNDDESFSKIVTKLTKVKKDLKRDDFCILATNNLGLLRKEFKIIHEGFTNAFRFIDYSRPWTWQPPNDYTFEIITSENQDHRDNENPSQKQSPVNLSIPLRSSFEEKPTRKRIKNYLTSALDGQPPIYFESNPKTLYYFSKNLVGKRFEDEVLKSDENVIIEFFKPTCPSCAVLSGSYEEFAKIVSQLQESMILEKGSGDSRLEYSLINKYKIQNPHKFKNLRVYRYNIYNESPVFPSPAATPLIFLFKNGQKTKPVLIDLVEDKININDSQKVIRNLIRIIDES